MRGKCFEKQESNNMQRDKINKQGTTPAWMNRRTFLRVGGAVAGLGFGTGMYTWRVEPHWLEIVERPLPIRNLPESLAGCRLIQLSDLHIGPQVDDAYILNTFQRVKELSPDIIVYTGDFISYERDGFQRAARIFPHLPQGRLATLGILGNHDYGPRWSQLEVADRIADLAGDAGVRVLRNEVAGVQGLQVAGLDDLWAGQFQPETALSALDPAKASLVLSHNPDTVDKPGWDDYSGWILSGHTHGGQCKPPFLPAPLLPVRNRRYTAGEIPLSGGRRLYISRGVGHLIQVRFNARPEVTAFQLEQA